MDETRAPRNVSKVGYSVTLRAFSVCCRYLAVSSLWCDGQIPTAHRTSPWLYLVTNFWYVTRSRVPSTLSRYGVTIRGNVTSVYAPLIRTSLPLSCNCSGHLTFLIWPPLPPICTNHEAPHFAVLFHRPVNFCLLNPSILPNNSFGSSFKMIDEVSHSYTTTGKITVKPQQRGGLYPSWAVGVQN